MKRIPWLVFAVLGIAGFQAKPMEKQLVGAWRYDIKTIKMELSPEARASAEKQSGKAAVDAQLQAGIRSLKQMLGPIVITFKSDHRFSLTAPGVQRKVTGKWSISGRSVQTKLDQPGPPAPEMTLSADGKRIKTLYRQPGFGTGIVYLVRK